MNRRSRHELASRHVAIPTVPEQPKRKLLDQVRDAIRVRHYSIRTEEAYTGWIKRYILFHGKRHPAEMGQAEITAFLSSLAVERNVSASTQNQAEDIDFAANQIVVRDGKGAKDRMTMLPAVVKQPLIDHLSDVQQIHERDLRAGNGHVLLPYSLARKYPNADRQWSWQWDFPARHISTDPRSGERRRHHLHESVLQRAVSSAARAARIPKSVHCHTLPACGYPAAAVQTKS
jgi:hypothetical protein